MTVSTPPVQQKEHPAVDIGRGPARVVVADNRFFARRGICQYLEMTPDIEVVGEAESGSEAVEVVRGLRPDVLLLETSLPDMDGAEVVRRLQSPDNASPDNASPGGASPRERGLPAHESNGHTSNGRKTATHATSSSRVVILSGCDEDRAIEELVDLGVAGYVDKRDSPAYLLEAVKNVVDGSKDWYSPRVSRVIMGMRRRGGVRQRHALTRREWDVLHLLAKGMSNSAIAQQLYVTEGTVKNHLTNIYEKLNVSSRTQAIVWMREHDFV